MDKYNHWLGKFLAWINRAEHYAITLGQTVYYSCSKETVDSNPWWRAHENQHKVQWRRDGYLRFATRYIWYNLTKGYATNPYEIEANQVAASQFSKTT